MYLCERETTFPKAHNNYITWSEVYMQKDELIPRDKVNKDIKVYALYAIILSVLGAISITVGSFIAESFSILTLLILGFYVFIIIQSVSIRKNIEGNIDSTRKKLLMDVYEKMSYYNGNFKLEHYDSLDAFYNVPSEITNDYYKVRTNENVDMKEFIQVKVRESATWGGRWDLNPQPSVPQTDALTN